MKTNILLSLGMACFAFLLVQAKVDSNATGSPVKADTMVIAYSGKVKAIIDNKCYGCHNPKSRSEKAKGKLNWDALPTLSKVDQISRLDKIVKVLDKGEMPPKKYLEHKPEGKLTSEETIILRDWAQKTSDILLK
jgi:uncharacterized membrane protein